METQALKRAVQEMATKPLGTTDQKFRNEYASALYAAEQELAAVERRAKHYDALVEALEWTHRRVHIPNDNGTPSCMMTCPARRILAALGLDAARLSGTSENEGQ